MKKIGFILILSILIGAVNVQKVIAGNIKLNGDDWNLWSLTMKGMFVYGVMNGTVIVSNETTTTLSAIVPIIVGNACGGKIESLHKEEIQKLVNDVISGEFKLSSIVLTIPKITKMCPKFMDYMFLLDMLSELAKKTKKFSLKGTVGQIVDVVDEFYANPLNRNIKIIDAIYVANMQIRGENPDLIDAQIRYLRMQPIDPKIRIQKMIECQIKISTQKLKKLKIKTKQTTAKDDSPDPEECLKGGLYVSKDGLSYVPLFCYGVYNH